jgi:tetratricopeptide (TPR) repeat protein
MKPATVALALVLTLPAAAAAQEWVGRGRVQGVVKNEAGEPIAGATVTLRLAENGPEPLTTNAKGRWTRLGLAHGDWSVIVDAEGYIGAQGAIKVYESGPGQSLDITLRRPTKEELAQAAANEQSAAIERLTQGNALIEAQQYAAARAEYEQALADLPVENHPPVLRAIANSFYAEGDVEQALATFERALALVPDDSELLQAVVNVLAAEGREEEAQVYFARLPADAELTPTTLLNFGIEAYNNGEMEKAFGHFDRLVAQNPELPDGYYYRGLVHLNNQNNAAAAADFNRLLELAPDHPKAAEARDFLAYLEK